MMFTSQLNPHDPIQLKFLYIYIFICNQAGWRPWLYNENVDEFYVITDDFTKHRKTNATKEIDEVDLGES